MNASTPIHTDPLLAEVFELLHRMELCQSREPFVWMASDALRKLTAYESQQVARQMVSNKA
ncbi:hypothetical protein [Paraburkholderia atlantica]|uniref:hypothetical protein n=1 Tax=Paraburkholderia atlantica TaxID=2654982 RepID=UPI0016180F53|nr:hypothetical protein [Paraburkholderia atlantica]MBB5508124.1 hypothetical protein [Paraburkholderia atlantica]